MANFNKNAASSRSLPHAEAREILAEAYRRLFHKEPTEGELNFGLATAFFESGYGRAGSANWAKPGQFARWAQEGLFNWGALESGIPGPERNFNKFKAAGLEPVKKLGTDAGRPAYFYLFPSDLQAAQAFLMSWGQPDTLQAAATNSPKAVAASMKNHRYYEGFWVPPGNPQGKKMPPFKEAASAEEAEQNNIRDYASALNRHVVAVNPNFKSQNVSSTLSVPKESNWTSLVKFFQNLESFLSKFITADNQKNNFLISIASTSNKSSNFEFARILSLALHDYFKIKTNIYSDPDSNTIELTCNLNGDKNKSFLAIKQLSLALAEEFTLATKKFGAIKVFPIVMADVNSDLPEMSLKEAEMHLRKFNLKIASYK